MHNKSNHCMTTLCGRHTKALHLHRLIYSKRQIPIFDTASHKVRLYFIPLLLLIRVTHSLGLGTKIFGWVQETKKKKKGWHFLFHPETKGLKKCLHPLFNRTSQIQSVERLANNVRVLRKYKSGLNRVEVDVLSDRFSKWSTDPKQKRRTRWRERE